MYRVELIFISLLALLLVVSYVESYNNFKSRIRHQVGSVSSRKPLYHPLSSTTSDEVPMNSETPAATASEPQGSGIAAYYQEVLTLLAKVPYAE